MQKDQVKSRRGVYYDLDLSPYYAVINHTVYKFSSYKKLQMFTKRADLAIEQLKKLQGKLFRICGKNLEKCYDLKLLYERACDKVYSDMLYK